MLSVVPGPDTLPDDLVAALADGSISRIVVTGQGTAAVAGRASPSRCRRPVRHRRRVEAVLATELSGFAMRPDMSDTLVVAISQSAPPPTPTAPSTWCAGRPGRRHRQPPQQRLCDKVDGVLYTSDGRDVEMSVASTKAFYAQRSPPASSPWQAGRRRRRRAPPPTARRCWPPSGTCPSAEATIATGPAIARPPISSHRTPPLLGHRGQRPNQIAARDPDQASELCYKSACDSTEDKKHIDLSSEPLISSAPPAWRVQRRRRGQGGGDLPRPQGRAGS